MGNFSWNLGSDDATASDSNQTHPQPEIPAQVVPATLVSAQIASAAVTAQGVATQDAASQKPLSRRELRHRAEAALLNGTAHSPVQAVEAESVAASESLESPVTEYFQIREPQAAAAHPSVDESQQSLAAQTVEERLTAPNPAPTSRRAARAERAVAAAKAARTASPLSPVPPRTAPVAIGNDHAVLKKGQPTPLLAPRRSSSDSAPRGRSTSSRVRGKAGRRRALFSKLFSVGAMLGVGALMISTTLPANAFYSAADAAGSPMTSVTSHAQSMKVASSATETAVSRDTYTVSSLAEQLRLQFGNRNFSYTNDINGTIQWPFPIPVPISSGFGPRIAPCGGCSSFHEGVDFIPGRGVAIGAIADGVVSAVVNTHSGLGNHVIVDHVINGQKVQSVYGHMLDGSIAVTVGEQVKVTQTLGLVGSTGESTGAHLHLEIHINGVPVDPFAWLKANAN
ncbi:MAG: peptidoglycan DD-metalloendopeptidase family protein [Lacisediminihabitans sp.]